jgi:putative ABC transport system ATP-binding protein/macrolide transport system ATP-binding/permease protein/lipoprotein-releasing system ATP-binding protein
MLRATNLAKVYPATPRAVEAVRDISLEVPPGQFLAVTGRSGSGKSTLLGMLGGICQPTRGTVQFEDRELGSLRDAELTKVRCSRIGFVFQFNSLLPTLRAIDNVALPALLNGSQDGALAYKRAESLLVRVGLAERLASYPGELSGGEQRRVAIARALINQPSLLLADEPTGDLDEETETEIIELLLELQRAEGLTLIVVTHNPAIAARADRVIQVKNGLIASEQTPTKQVEPAPVQHPTNQLVTSSEKLTEAQPQLGEGLLRFLGSCAAWAILTLVLLLAVNQGLAFYQQQQIDHRAEARKALEELAMSGLRADIANITLDADGSYHLSLYLWNVTDGKPLHVLAPSVHAYVQVGTSWTEVPLRAADDQEGRVHEVTGKQHYNFRFTPDVAKFEELLPGYLHMRFTNLMLISPRSEPTDDLVERTDNYYVYLKPRDADDAAILKKLKFPGKPPLWIPMPPH